MMKKYNLVAHLLFLCCFFLIAFQSVAQSGSLDLSFGNNGIVITNIDSLDSGRSVAIQADGKIVVAGETFNGNDYDFAVVRYLTNGTPDVTFGNAGAVTTDIDSSEYGRSVAIQADGKIVVGGTIVNNDYALVRYNANGTLDNTFGNGGKVITNLPGFCNAECAIVIQSDGKIVLTGTIHNMNESDMLVIRYNTNGSLDNGFGNGGVQKTPIGTEDDIAFAVALQVDGKIVVCGASESAGNTHMAVVRYNSNGTLDSTFGTGGKQTTVCGVGAFGYGLVIQNDGKIVVAGWTMPAFPDRDFMVVRYQPNGTLDNTFGNAGITVTAGDSTDQCRAVALLSDGKILLGGTTRTATGIDFRLDCYNSDGSFDVSFGNAGLVTTNINGNDAAMAIAVQADGKILLAGGTNSNNQNQIDFAVVRYHYSIDMPEGTGNISNPGLTLRNYPNPFDEQTTFQFDIPFMDATLSLFDMSGKMVKQLEHLYGKEIVLYRSLLPAGVYSAQLIQDNTKIAAGRVVICD